MKENDVVRSCLEYLKFKGIFAWRTNTMGTWRGDGYSFNGTPGVADIIGVLPQAWHKVKFGNILCIEAKRPKKYGGRGLSEAQESFKNRITEEGGLYLMVTSVQELEEGLKDYV